MARVRCPDGHRKTAYLGGGSYGDDVYECCRCERIRSRGESARFIVRRARKRGRR